MSDGPKIYRDDIRLAYKKHKCYECDSIISKGEIYHVFTGLWDGWNSFKSCSSCNKLRHEIDSASNEPICFGELQDHVFEGSDTDQMKRFIDNMILRDTIIPEWMREKLQEDRFNRGRTKFVAAMLKL